MAALWLLTLLAAAAHEREPLLLHVAGALDPAQEAAIRAGAAKAVSRLTLLECAAGDARALKRCEERGELMCWLRAARASDVRPRYFLGVTAHPEKGGKIAAALLLIDLERGERWANAAGGGESAEDEIFETAAVTWAGDVDGPEEAFFARFLGAQARGRLEASGHWFPNGAIEVAADRAGLSIAVDDRPAGTTTGAGAVTIDGLSEGNHTVLLTDPRGLVSHHPEVVAVQAGAVTALTPSLVEGSNPAPAIRRGIAWGGAAVAAIGVGLTVYAAVAPRRAFVARVCPGGACPDAEGGFAGFADLGTEPLAEGEGGGVRVAPLGFALIAAGGTWAAGSLLIGDDWEVPWLPLLVGAAGGAAVYGIAASFR